MHFLVLIKNNTAYSRELFFLRGTLDSRLGTRRVIHVFWIDFLQILMWTFQDLSLPRGGLITNLTQQLLDLMQ